MAVSRSRNRDLARLGASVRLAQIAAEQTSILEIFPDLRRATTSADATGLSRPRRHMSAKARKAMSEGMRRYWAKRKAAHR